MAARVDDRRRRRVAARNRLRDAADRSWRAGLAPARCGAGLAAKSLAAITGPSSRSSRATVPLVALRPDRSEPSREARSP
jgi:hypothetical protein